MAHSEFTRTGTDTRISVLFIHGIGGTPNHFKAFVPLVPERFSVCNMLLAVDRPVKQGAEKQADFPKVICFGNTAENCGKYLDKGSLVAVHGYLQTGSYQNKNGDTVYTTDVVANRVEFLERAKKAEK